VVSTLEIKHPESLEERRNGKVLWPLDAIVADSFQYENQWGSGGVNSPRTGPDFGCIHFDAKAGAA
jgi:hypothetical protein